MRAVLGAYRKLLRNRRLTALLGAEFVSSIGDWLYLVALLIIIYDRTHDPVLLGIVGFMRVLPYVIFSIPAGILADRVDRRLLLLSTDLARGAIMVVLGILVAANAPIEPIVALTILATCFSSFFGPAIGAYLPSLVQSEDELGPANTLYATLENVAFIIGPAVAAIVVGVGNVSIAFFLNAVSFAFVAVVLWRLPPNRAGQADATAKATTDDDASAASAAPPPSLRAVARPLSGLLLLDLAQGFAFGGMGVLTVIIAFDRLGIGEEGTGLLNAAVGVGGLLGAVVSGALVLRRRLAPPLAFGAFLLAVSIAVIGLTSSLFIVLIAMGATALGSLIGSVVSTTLFQRLVPDNYRGRTLGVLETIAILAYASGALVLPPLAQSQGLDRTLVGSAILVVLAVLVAVPLIGPHATQAPAIDPQRAALERVPLFAGLAPASIERAERRAHVITARTGEVLIRQGAEADRFYVIVDGQVEVTQTAAGGTGPITLRQMGPDEVFGEIGLLSGVPRTATVTAIQPTTLLALEKRDFLDLVAASPGLTFPLLDAHRGAVAGG